MNASWVVIDPHDYYVIGFWNDIESAEDFFLDNTDDDDCWAVMPFIELTEVYC